MNITKTASIVLAGVMLAAAEANAVDVDLMDWTVNIDGNLTVTGDPLPGGVDDSGFNLYGDGLGILRTTVTGAGDHFIGWFFDHEIDLLGNFYNEIGSAIGTPVVGQTWEIDEPGWGADPEPYVGDIYANLQGSDAFGSMLDELVFHSVCNPMILGDPALCDEPEDFLGAPVGNAYDVTVPLSDYESPVMDDVSMAMGWGFALGDGEKGTLTLNVSDTSPGGGFFLTQTDLGTGEKLYMYAGLRIQDVPAPATLLLMAAGLLGIGGVARRRS